MKLTIFALAAGAVLAAFTFGCRDKSACSGVCLPGKPAAAPIAAPVAMAEISTDALAAMLRAHAAAVVLDARTGKYDDGRRLPGAQALAPDASAADAATFIPDKTSLVVTYCANPQCPASDHLARHLRELGYTNVIEYRGGIETWVNAGLPFGTRCPDCGETIPADM